MCIQGGNITIPRIEDMIIGYTWGRFIEDPSPNPDPDIIALFPMTKASHSTDSHTEILYIIILLLLQGFSYRCLLSVFDRSICHLQTTVHICNNLLDFH